MLNEMLSAKCQVLAKIKGDWTSPSVAKFWSGLQSPDVLRLPALRAFYDIKLNLLAFLQTAEAI
jgi:hypothetical protein